MPKLPKNERDIRLIEKIEEYQKLYSISNADLSAAMGCSVGTFYGRKRRPERLTIKEIRAIVNKCHIPMTEIFPYL